MATGKQAYTAHALLMMGGIVTRNMQSKRICEEYTAIVASRNYFHYKGFSVGHYMLF